MQQRRAESETIAEPCNELRRQANLRHQNKHLFALLKNVLYPLQIDFCFAAARYPIKQIGTKLIAATQCAQSVLLMFVQS